MDNLEFRTTSDSIEWRSEDTSWTTLVYLKDIRGRIGDTGPAGPEGPEGRRIELHTSPTHLQWGYADEGVWYNVVSLASIQGPKGEPGTDGKDGKDGEIGPQGPKGLMGPTGAKGERGILGPKGERGQIGAQGSDGKNGKDGINGKDGDKGPKGDKGDTGARGPKGSKGDKGDKPRLGTDYFVVAGPPGMDADISRLVPYVGASRDIDLGIHGITAATSRFGSKDNYTDFNREGHQTMVGTAKPWDDLRVEPIARGGTNAPTYEKWFDNGAGSRGVFVYSFLNAVLASEDEVFFNMQMPHGWDGGPIHMHVHWITKTSEANAKVRWGLEYTWTDIGQVFGNTKLDYQSTDVAGNTGVTVYTHYLTEFTDITPSATQDGLSSILICRLWRNSSHADDTYTGDAGLLYIDAYYQMNSLGSTDELSK